MLQADPCSRLESLINRRMEFDEPNDAFEALRGGDVIGQVVMMD